MCKRGTCTGSYQANAHVERYVRTMNRIPFENFTEIITATCT